MGLKDRLRIFNRHTSPGTKNEPSTSILSITELNILRSIFANTSQRDLARSARVCRAWNHVCTEWLYASIHFNPHKNSIAADHLARTLRTSSNSRGRIRKLKIEFNTWSPGGSLYSWLALFRGGSLLKELHVVVHLALDGEIRDLVRTATFPTVSHLVVDNRVPYTKPVFGFAIPPSLTILASSGHYESLEAPTFIPKTLETFTRVMRTEEFPIAFLDMAPPSLHRIYLFIKNDWTYRAEHWEQLIQTISKMPQLTELMITGTIQPTGYYPVMDLLVPHLPNLRTLYCGTGLYTPALFPSLPPTLEILGLGKTNTPETLELIREVQQGKRALTTMYLEYEDRVIQEVCQDAGIHVEVINIHNARFADAMLEAKFSDLKQGNTNGTQKYTGPRGVRSGDIQLASLRK